MARPSAAGKTPITTMDDKLARESDVTVSTNATSYAEYKGFFMYVGSTTLLVIFSAWILLPDLVLAAIGISYYPDKYWAQAIPAYFLIVMLFLYILLALYNTEIQTKPLNDIRLFTDEHTVYPDDPVAFLHKTPSGVSDLPILLVNEVLYGDFEAE